MKSFITAFVRLPFFKSRVLETFKELELQLDQLRLEITELKKKNQEQSEYHQAFLNHINSFNGFARLTRFDIEAIQNTLGHLPREKKSQFDSPQIDKI